MLVLHGPLPILAPLGDKQLESVVEPLVVPSADGLEVVETTQYVVMPAGRERELGERRVRHFAGAM